MAENMYMFNGLLMDKGEVQGPVLTVGFMCKGIELECLQS